MLIRKCICFPVQSHYFKRTGVVFECTTIVLNTNTLSLMMGVNLFSNQFQQFLSLSLSPLIYPVFPNEGKK